VAKIVTSGVSVACLVVAVYLLAACVPAEPAPLRLLIWNVGNPAQEDRGYALRL
jgi:hypothetical protein